MASSLLLTASSSPSSLNSVTKQIQHPVSKVNSYFSKRLAPFLNRMHVRFPKAFGKQEITRVKQFSVQCASSSESPDELSKKSGSGKDEWYGLRTGIGFLGLIETAYLTFMKVTDGDVYCLAGSESCSDVLNSSYAYVFDVPLVLIGMISYGIVSFTCLELSRTRTLFGLEKDKARWILLGLTSSMASASAYFMYLLIVMFEGASCAYCVTSAFLCLSLLVLSFRDFRNREILQVVGLQIMTAILIVASLSKAYSMSAPAYASLENVELPPIEPEVTTHSSPLAISLAKHLHSIGAKLYGAFWCSHCYEQKQVFGAEASNILDYVECYPNGYKKGVKISKACEEANIQGFPTWIIKEQVLSGEQEFDELARASGFDIDNPDK